MTHPSFTLLGDVDRGRFVVAPAEMACGLSARTIGAAARTAKWRSHGAPGMRWARVAIQRRDIWLFETGRERLRVLYGEIPVPRSRRIGTVAGRAIAVWDGGWNGIYAFETTLFADDEWVGRVLRTDGVTCELHVSHGQELSIVPRRERSDAVLFHGACCAWFDDVVTGRDACVRTADCESIDIPVLALTLLAHGEEDPGEKRSRYRCNAQPAERPVSLRFACGGPILERPVSIWVDESTRRVGFVGWDDYPNRCGEAELSGRITGGWFPVPHLTGHCELESPDAVTIRSREEHAGSLGVELPRWFRGSAAFSVIPLLLSKGQIADLLMFEFRRRVES